MTWRPWGPHMVQYRGRSVQRPLLCCPFQWKPMWLRTQLAAPTTHCSLVPLLSHYHFLPKTSLAVLLSQSYRSPYPFIIHNGHNNVFTCSHMPPHARVSPYLRNFCEASSFLFKDNLILTCHSHHSLHANMLFYFFPFFLLS